MGAGRVRLESLTYGKAFGVRAGFFRMIERKSTHPGVGTQP
jgi:hypothetical protein